MMVWAVVWILIVAAATVSVWSAISRAGAHVTNPAAPKLPTSTAVTPTPEPTPEATPRASQATPLPTPRTTPRATSRPTHRETTTGTAGPAAVQGSWSGQAGRVTATCRGQRIKLDAAVPADGFTVQIGNRGPETLEIEFHRTRGEGEFKVKGTCRSGGPQFVVEED